MTKDRYSVLESDPRQRENVADVVARGLSMTKTEAVVGYECDVDDAVERQAEHDVDNVSKLTLNDLGCSHDVD